MHQSDEDLRKAYAAMGRRLPPHVPAPTVPATDLHYDIMQLMTPAQAQSIATSGILSFHVVGDSGNDSWHTHHMNGGPRRRQAVVAAMEKQRAGAPNDPETPFFCMHTGDLVYPHASHGGLEEEFYTPFEPYRNYVLAIPGNHDYGQSHSDFHDFMAAFCQAHITPSLPGSTGRSAMNLPGLHYVLETPVATIVAMAAISDYISSNQRDWAEAAMKGASTEKALIVAIHYPPYCFDGSDNRGVRAALNGAIYGSGRSPDLVICGHAHNYQRIDVPHPQYSGSNGPVTLEPYPVLVVGSGGVGTSPVDPYCGGNGSELKSYCKDAFGALKLVVDIRKGEIRGSFESVERADPEEAPFTDFFFYPFSTTPES